MTLTADPILGERIETAAAQVWRHVAAEEERIESGEVDDDEIEACNRRLAALKDATWALEARPGPGQLGPRWNWPERGPPPPG